MPMYEFACVQCGEPFEELVRSPQAIKDVTCPACGSRKVKKKLSTFASRAAGHMSESSAASACSAGGT